MHSILSTSLNHEYDVVSARQRARQIAGLLGFDNVLQTRIATAVSEIARNAFEYAKGGKVEFLFDVKAQPQAFYIRVTDSGKGIASLQDILDGAYQSPSGMGLGIIGTKRLMDSFQIESDASGTLVLMSKMLPKKSASLTAKEIAKLADELVKTEPRTPFEEMQQQNRELMGALQEVEKRQIELGRLNQELSETNRGVVALYAELDERAEHLKRADEVKTRFLSHMSHEFRTPVHSALSLTSFLLDRSDGELTPEQEKQVQLIRNSMESLSVLVNDLLDLAKVEAGKVTVRADRFRVPEVFGSLRGMFKPLLTNPKVELKFESAEHLPELHTDEGKIAQILRNFISNALKFTEEGEIRISAEYDKKQHYIIFSVTDTGIGIPLHEKARIFEEFSQVEHHLQRKSKGTGLGLPLSRKLAELLGGMVDVDSTPGQGSVFSLTVPRHYVDPLAEEQEEQQHTSWAKALIIDDDEASYYALKRGLSSCECDVVVAETGMKGLRLAKEVKPDVIFLDLMMPHMSGFEVIEHLKNDMNTRDIPVIIHSTKTLTEAEKAHLEKLAFAFLPKTASFQEIIHYIKTAMPTLVCQEAI